MISFVNGEKLLTDSDLPPQWNLLTGTSNFDGFQNANLQKSKDAFGNAQALIDTAWQSPAKLFNVLAGQIICFSAVIQATDSSKLPEIGFFGGDTKYGGTATVAGNNAGIDSLFYIDGVSQTNGFFLSDTNPHIAYTFFAITRSGLFNPRIEMLSNAPLLYSSVKAELGNKRTNWMPAISDLMLKNQNRG